MRVRETQRGRGGSRSGCTDTQSRAYAHKHKGADG